jgi:ferrous iron transport protein A
VPVLLDSLANGDEAIVTGVHARDGITPELLRRLVEIGFLPGERVRVVARGALGGTPIAVRIGTSTFALRRIEARCVEVTLAAGNTP